VLIAGGLGYLGFNLARRFHELGYSVHIAARRSSLARVRLRQRLYRDIVGGGYARVHLLDGGVGEVCQLVGRLCPDILVAAMGRLSGSTASLVESNALTPSLWLRCLAERCPRSLGVYVSAIVTVGLQHGCRRGLAVEEASHLQGYTPAGVFAAAKALGEHLSLRACQRGGGRVVAVRPGLPVGEWSYHPEWLTLYSLASRGTIIQGVKVHVTPADRLADAIAYLDAKECRCCWVNAAPWRVDIGELMLAIARHAGARVRARLNLQALGGLVESLPGTLGYMARLSRCRIASRHIPPSVWGRLSESLGRLASWLHRAFRTLNLERELPSSLARLLRKPPL
jgi:nucleoside-diphosphate-sugar epimerase